MQVGRARRVAPRIALVADLAEENGRYAAALLHASLEVGCVPIGEATPFCTRPDDGWPCGVEVRAHRIAIEMHGLRGRPLGIALRDEVADLLIASHADGQTCGLLTFRLRWSP